MPANVRAPPAQGRDVDGVANAVQPGQEGAQPGRQAPEWYLLKRDVAARDARDRRGCLRAGELVAGELDPLSGRDRL
jgi:hypothetical protein